jgi:hypothetical protein
MSPAFAAETEPVQEQYSDHRYQEQRPSEQRHGHSRAYLPVVSELRVASGEQPLQAGLQALRLLHELRGLLLTFVAACAGVDACACRRPHPGRRFPLGHLGHRPLYRYLAYNCGALCPTFPHPAKCKSRIDLA